MSGQGSPGFLASFVRHPRQVGAVWPSSPALAAAMTDGLPRDASATVLELGPGTGAFTGAILAACGDGSPYLGIEINAAFVRTLQRRFASACAAGARFAHGSAESMVGLHRDAGLPPVRAVLCGLPFASLPVAVQDGVLAALDELLKDGGTFRTFQYVHAFHLPAARRFRARMAERFGPARRSTAVWRNTPPAFVVEWTRPAAGAG